MSVQDLSFQAPLGNDLEFLAEKCPVCSHEMGSHLMGVGVLPTSPYIGHWVLIGNSGCYKSVWCECKYLEDEHG